MVLPGSEAENELQVKIRFFATSQIVSEEDNANGLDEQRIRVRFTKKRGDLQFWATTFNNMREGGLDELLLAPEKNQNIDLTEGI